MPFSLLMIDVDNFKKHNDHYGHTALTACVRLPDVLQNVWAKPMSTRLHPVPLSPATVARNSPL
ncbi:diguanylate cyclase [Dechloromonas sp.]|uniref:diguanylate cyclase domain-containing protein n=1 Tax=Dechloromonas sp. TaxID=1917218 RepID=UPI00345F6E2E